MCVRDCKRAKSTDEAVGSQNKGLGASAAGTLKLGGGGGEGVYSRRVCLSEKEGKWKQQSKLQLRRGKGQRLERSILP